MPNSRASAAYLVERFGPVLSAIAWLIIAYFFRAWFSTNIVDGKIVLNGLFSAVFGWAAIQTGFVFSVYGFVTTKSGGFVERFRDTPDMRRFERYVMQAMFMGFVLTIYSIPLMIWSLDIKSSISYWIVATWFGSFVWAFAAFLRVALNFGKLVSVKEDDFIPG